MAPIALICFVVLAAAADEAEIVVEAADLDVAEHRQRGWHYGGYRVGRGGYRRGGSHGQHGLGRKRRAVEDEPLAADLETAENGRGGYGGRGHQGGHRGGGHGGRGGGHGGRGGGHGGRGGYSGYGGYSHHG